MARPDVMELDPKLVWLLLALCRTQLGYPRGTTPGEAAYYEDHAVITAFVEAQKPRCSECGRLWEVPA